MARLTDKKRNDIINQFHLGKSQYQLAKDFEVSPATINRLCKDLTPKLKDEVNVAVALNTTLSKESECLVNAFDKEVNEKTRRAGLVFGGMEKLAQLTNKHVTNNKAQKVVTGKFGSDVVETELQSSDLKNLSDTYEKLGKSLGVIETTPSVQIANQNVQEKANDIKIVVEG